MAYVIHFYADGHGVDLLDHYKAAAAELPVFATEWSPAHYGRLEPFRTESAAPWVQWMADAQVGGAYWIWGAGDDLWATFDKSTTADGPFAHDGANVTASGHYLYDWLNNPRDAWADQMFDPDNPVDVPGADPGTGPVGMDPVAMDPVPMDPVGTDPVAMVPAGGGSAGTPPGPAASDAGANALGASIPNSAAGCGCRVKPSGNTQAAWLLVLAGILGLRRRDTSAPGVRARPDESGESASP